MKTKAILLFKVLKEDYLKSPVFEGFDDESLEEITKAYVKAMKKNYNVIEVLEFPSNSNIEAHVLANPIQHLPPE